MPGTTDSFSRVLSKEPNTMHETNTIARDSVILLTALALPLALFVAGLTACGPENDARQGEPIEVTGILTAEGTTSCQALRAEDGTLYTLVGDLRTFGNGDVVRVTGSVANGAVCDQGITIDVTDLESGEPGGEEELASMPPEQVFLEGRLTDEGVECQAIRDFEGELYTLTGDLGSLSNMQAGDPIRILGRPIDASPCQQGTTLEIMEVTRLSEDMLPMDEAAAPAGEQPTA